MHIDKVAIKNFRLLQDVHLNLEKATTLIVGRNNSGKTAITELFRRLLSEDRPRFFLEDFSLSVHDQFYQSFLRFEQSPEDLEIELPYIEIFFGIDYSSQDLEENLGLLSKFIVELDDDCSIASIRIRYQLKPSGLQDIFSNIRTEIVSLKESFTEDDTNLTAEEKEILEKKLFFRILRGRMQKNFHIQLVALDPTNSSNQASIEWAKLRELIQSGFVTAQRGLDDITHKDQNTLGKILETLFNNAMTQESNTTGQQNAGISGTAVVGIMQGIDTAVQKIQNTIDDNFTDQLVRLLPSLSMFGYPNLRDPDIKTETILDAQRLLKDHTRIYYGGVNGVNLPESYNGLGARNLIYILLNLHNFFNQYKSTTPKPSFQIIFIEEPEAHLHPQMQAVFIRQLNKIVEIFSKEYETNWPVQFVVTTHSSHLANEAPFEAVRYFTTKPSMLLENSFEADIKDLRFGPEDLEPLERDFMHQYMTLTRCDLLFADKAILIEGTCERILLPKIIEKIDSDNEVEKLSSQYISVVEVGGAYAHIFFKLLDYLELPTLIITDLDSVMSNDSSSRKKSCRVYEGTNTSNACIKEWFDEVGISPQSLIGKSEESKIKDNVRIAYQLPETEESACGRTLEDAFILANMELFGISKGSEKEMADEAYDEATNYKKSEFAIKYAVNETTWLVPKYIREGLEWLRDTYVIENKGLPEQ